MKISTIRRTVLCLFVSTIMVTSIFGQRDMNPEKWKSDLAYFQDLVHKKYPNLFYNVSAKQFDSAIAVTREKIGRVNDVQMTVEFAKLLAMFRIGHTALRQRYGTGNNVVPWVHTIPVRFYLFSDGMFIKSIDPAFAEAVGGKLIKIGNTAATVAFEKLRPVIAYENEQGFRSLLPAYLTVAEYLYATGIIPDTSSVSLTYLKDGKERTVILPSTTPKMGTPGRPINLNWPDAYPVDNAIMPLWLKHPGKFRYFEYLPDSKTVYVKHRAVLDETDETIASFFGRVFRFIDSADVDKLILDIRLNGGGNNYLNKPVITGIIQSKKINRKGHLFVVLGKETFSAAQNLTNELEKYTELLFVGEPTSENVNFFGDTRTEVLPASKLNVNLSWLWWQNHDPRDKRKSTVPHLAVDLSSEDYKNGIDPVINTILKYN